MNWSRRVCAPPIRSSNSIFCDAPKAYPIFALGFEQHLDTVVDYLKPVTTLCSTGRQGAFCYPNMHGAMRMGADAARAILDQLSPVERKKDPAHQTTPKFRLFPRITFSRLTGADLLAPRGETDHWFTVFAVAILCVITLVVYGQIVFFDFVNYDDPFFISLNPHVMSGLTRDNILWAFSTSDMGIWHPLTWMSYQLEISVFGAGNPGGHHAVNLFLHVSNAVLVLLLFTRLTGKLWASLLVAVLFSIHPQHVQPVVWIAERKEVLAAVFFLLSVYLYAGHRCQPGTKGTYLASLAVFGVALMCKPSVAPLPVILILVDLFCRYPNNGRGLVMMAPAALAAARFKHLLSNKIPFFLLSAIVSAITIYIKKTGHWAGYEESLHLGRRLLLMPIGFMHYLKTLVVPWPNPLWIEAPEGMPYLQSLLSAAVIGVLGFVIWRARGALSSACIWSIVVCSYVAAGKRDRVGEQLLRCRPLYLFTLYRRVVRVGVFRQDRFQFRVAWPPVDDCADRRGGIGRRSTCIPANELLARQYYIL